MYCTYLYLYYVEEKMNKHFCSQYTNIVVISSFINLRKKYHT
jgi:hypothetical protein